MQRLAPLRRLRLSLHPRSCTRASSQFTRGPSPPKLPAEQQAEFERLQREAAVSSAFQPEALEKDKDDNNSAANTQSQASPAPEVADDGLNPAYFRGAKPEFDGDVNPKTGEVGGPKNEPLRWGGEGDWSYNGRVTDF